MRILLVNRWYPIGGVGNYVRIMASALADLGHSVTVLAAANSDGTPKTVHDARIPVYSIRYPATPFRIRKLPFAKRYYRTIETFLYARRVKSMRRRIEDEAGKFDITEYAEVNAEGLYHTGENGPFVVRLHMPTFVFEQVMPGSLGYSTRWIGQWEREVILRAHGIVSPSQDLAGRVAAYCQLEETKILILPNPINLTEFSPTPIEKTATLSILYIGNLTERKGAFVMAEAARFLFERYAQAHILFAGSDETLPDGSKGKDRIARIIGQPFLDKIQFTGFVSQSVLANLIRAADICVTPSFYENCPYAALEVMACGRPLVASRNSGFIEMVQDGETGLLFETGSAQDLANKILQLADNPDLALSLAANAYRRVSAHYAAREVAEKQIGFYLRSLR